MSSDNGIYILTTYTSRIMEGNAQKACPKRKVFRVAHVQAIDNFDWFQNVQPENIGAYLKENWGESEVYDSEQKAIEAAHELAKTIEALEYGVSKIQTEYTFYGD